MNIVEIIETKKNNQKLTQEEIEYAISSFLSGEVEDSQMSALLMAICINGMDEEETIQLTEAMYHSGKSMDLSFMEENIVDKHSTGGVGDKTTLVVCPLVAACGVPIFKMSGRGLGFTGGTIDKLKSIEGFQVDLAMKEIKKILINHKMVLASQSKDLNPADKKMYALRDVTGTVESLPLIASSVMSKKLTSGCNKLVLDVKVGEGALMKTLDDAKELAKIMVRIGDHFGRETVAVLTNMGEPLGYTIGNSLEVVEAISTLKGRGEQTFTALCIELASWMVSLGKEIDFVEAREQVIQALESGKGYEKFREIIQAQGGNIDKFDSTKHKIDIKSVKTGYVNDIKTYELGELSRSLGAGRYHEDDVIDYSVGLVLNKKCGDFVNEGDILGKIYTNDELDYEEQFLSAFIIEEEKRELEALILGIVK